MKIKVFELHKILKMMVLTSMLISCQYQQNLCFDHDVHDCEPVRVVLDWTDCTDANPGAMCIYVFSDNMDVPMRFDLKSKRGGVIWLSPGRHYSAIALNSNIENTAVRYNKGIESFELCLRGSFTARTSDIRNASDMVWLGVTEDIIINGGLLTIAMHEAVCRCEVDVKHIANRARLRSTAALLSGFNESLAAVRHIGKSESIRIGFDMHRDSETSLHAELLTLGHCGVVESYGDSVIPDSLHNLSLCFNFTDGTSWQYTEDVTQQIHAQPSNYCHIVIDSIALPLTGNLQNGGFDYSVDDWQTVDIQIRP